MKCQQTRKYWCYGCQHYISSSYEIYSCTRCDSQAIQLNQRNEQQQNLSKFKSYELKQQKQKNKVIGKLQNGVIPQYSVARTVISVYSTQHTLQDIPQGTFLGNLLRQLINQGNTLTPATQQQIQRLHKIQKISQCSICQCGQHQQSQQQIKQSQNYQNYQGYKLKCNHQFHIDCIKPWFQRTNTCPVCRRKIDQ